MTTIIGCGFDVFDANGKRFANLAGVFRRAFPIVAFSAGNGSLKSQFVTYYGEHFELRSRPPVLPENKKFWRAETHEYGEIVNIDFSYRDNVEDAIDDAKNALGSLSAKEHERETAFVYEWEEVQEGVFETTGNVRDVLTSLEKPNG